jgi:(p)ppGpp synthase/HD superfamily hydrolase
MGVIEEAIAFAALAHMGQRRKKTGLPFIWHPLAVGRLLQDEGFPQTVVAAGILHDTVEDTPVTLAEVRERFGEEVAEIVDGCTEPEHKTRPWEERKQHTIDFMRTARFEVRVVAAADKIDNLRAIAIDFGRVGEEVWTRFKRGREKQAWYYREVTESIRMNGEAAAIFDLLGAEVARVFGPK